MEATGNSELGSVIPTEILVAIEDTKLRLMVARAIKAVDRDCHILPPGQLLHCEYPGGYLIFLETGNDLQRLKDIARQICNKWGRNGVDQTCLDNFFMAFFIRPEILKDDYVSLWSIAGWDATSIMDPDTKNYQENSRFIQSLATRVRSHLTP